MSSLVKTPIKNKITNNVGSSISFLLLENKFDEAAKLFFEYIVTSRGTSLEGVQKTFHKVISDPAVYKILLEANTKIVVNEDPKLRYLSQTIKDTEWPYTIVNMYVFFHMCIYCLYKKKYIYETTYVEFSKPILYGEAYNEQIMYFSTLAIQKYNKSRDEDFVFQCLFLSL